VSTFHRPAIAQSASSNAIPTLCERAANALRTTAIGVCSIPPITPQAFEGARGAHTLARRPLRRRLRGSGARPIASRKLGRREGRKGLDGLYTNVTSKNRFRSRSVFAICLPNRCVREKIGFAVNGLTPSVVCRIAPGNAMGSAEGRNVTRYMANRVSNAATKSFGDFSKARPERPGCRRGHTRTKANSYFLTCFKSFAARPKNLGSSFPDRRFDLGPIARTRGLGCCAFGRASGRAGCGRPESTHQRPSYSVFGSGA
jgi:hypothetical protein